jgi:hypothetical protein
MDAVVDDDRGDEVAKQGAAMAGVATQLESAFTVAHDFSPSAQLVLSAGVEVRRVQGPGPRVQKTSDQSF